MNSNIDASMPVGRTLEDLLFAFIESGEAVGSPQVISDGMEVSLGIAG